MSLQGMAGMTVEEAVTLMAQHQKKEAETKSFGFDDASEDDSDALLEGLAEVGFAAASLFRCNVGNHASTSAEVELEDGSTVYVTVTIDQD